MNAKKKRVKDPGEQQQLRGRERKRKRMRVMERSSRKKTGQEGFVYRRSLRELGKRH